MTKAVERYLSRHARPEAEVAEALTRSYRHAVVIPICREPDLSACLEALVRNRQSGPVLVIGVVNARADASSDTHRVNEQTLRDHGCAGRSWAQTSLAAEVDLLVVNRAEGDRLLAPKQGVGTARRIGADIAVRLWQRGQLSSGWVHSTDADARVPEGYFQAPENVVARVLPFRHQTEREALVLYEAGLRFFVLGLLHARSAYAFQTLGSALAFRCETYAQVGGFPQRLAGEDFYLLNKLAKVGAIERSEGSPLVLVDRDSDRVPFGTGPGARRIANTRARGEGFRTYDPRCFDALEAWYGALQALSEHRDVRQTREAIHAVHPALWGCLEGLGVEAGLRDAVEQTTRQSDLHGRLLRWFDALKALRWVHALRDSVWPLVPWQQAAEAMATRHGAPVSEGADLGSLLASLEAGRAGEVEGVPVRVNGARAS